MLDHRLRVTRYAFNSVTADPVARERVLKTTTSVLDWYREVNRFLELLGYWAIGLIF